MFDYILDYMLDYVLDHMIIDSVTTALQVVLLEKPQKSV